jgi:hypothetical protein
LAKNVFEVSRANNQLAKNLLLFQEFKIQSSVSASFSSLTTKKNLDKVFIHCNILTKDEKIKWDKLFLQFGAFCQHYDLKALS